MPLRDIAIEKEEAQFQGRGAPRALPLHVGPGDAVADPLECRAPEVPADFPPDVRRYFEFGTRMVQNLVGPTVEQAFDNVMAKALDKIPFQVVPPWLVPPVDSVPVDVQQCVDLPANMNPNFFIVVVFIVNHDSRTSMYIDTIGTSLPSAAAFDFVRWRPQFAEVPPTLPPADFSIPPPATTAPPPPASNDTITRAVPGYPERVGQWSSLNDPSDLPKPICVPPRTSLILLANNSSGTALQACGRFKGWRTALPWLSSNLLEYSQGTATASMLAAQQFGFTVNKDLLKYRGD